MANLVWVGGGNNKASNHKDWSPDQAPAPGDTLNVVQGSAPYTINVAGNDLAGDSLVIEGEGTTVNLAERAVADLNFSFGTGTVNLSGSDTLNLTGSQAGITVNLAPDSTWTGTLVAGVGRFSPQVTINAGAGAVFDNDGASSVGPTDTKIPVRVEGTGSFAVRYGTLEFLHAVGSGQSITVSTVPIVATDIVGGTLQIDQPNRFHASTILSYQTAYPVSAGSTPQIDLEGLANADSYTFKNDILSIYSGNSIIDRLRLTDSTLYGFVVEKAAGSVNIVAIGDPNNPPAGLPVHTV